MRTVRPLLLLLGVLLTIGPATAADLENTLYLDVPEGRVVIEMLPDVAPNHVARIKQLVRQGFYDGLPFHRVIDGFMAQTGDPTGTGEGGSGVSLPLEPSDIPHERGTVSMARGAHPNSGDSQFFILFVRKRHLDRRYTVWGRVTSGLDLVERLKKAPADDERGFVENPDHIVQMRVAADVEAGRS